MDRDSYRAMVTLTMVKGLTSGVAREISIRAVTSSRRRDDGEAD